MSPLTAASPDVLSLNAKFARDFALADLLNEDLLIPRLAADSKISAINELVDALHSLQKAYESWTPQLL